MEPEPNEHWYDINEQGQAQIEYQQLNVSELNQMESIRKGSTLNNVLKFDQNIMVCFPTKSNVTGNVIILNARKHVIKETKVPCPWTIIQVKKYKQQLFIFL